MGWAIFISLFLLFCYWTGKRSVSQAIEKDSKAIRKALERPLTLLRSLQKSKGGVRVVVARRRVKALRRLKVAMKERRKEKVTV